MPIDYCDLGLDELNARIAAIDQALDGGSQTGVGIEPRISHMFAAKSDDELRVRRNEYAYSRFLLAQENGKADLIAKYRNPYNRAGITRPNFC